MGCQLIEGKSEGKTEEEYLKYCRICLNCPYPRCVLDYLQRSTIGKKEKIERNAQIVQMAGQGKTILELAGLFKLSERSIYKVLEEN